MLRRALLAALAAAVERAPRFSAQDKCTYPGGRLCRHPGRITLSNDDRTAIRPANPKP